MPKKHKHAEAPPEDQSPAATLAPMVEVTAEPVAPPPPPIAAAEAPLGVSDLVTRDGELVGVVDSIEESGRAFVFAPLFRVVAGHPTFLSGSAACMTAAVADYRRFR